jgi:hypothetical protein
MKNKKAIEVFNKRRQQSALTFLVIEKALKYRGTEGMKKAIISQTTK